jgi:hypothetical protein
LGEPFEFARLVEPVNEVAVGVESHERRLATKGWLSSFSTMRELHAKGVKIPRIGSGCACDSLEFPRKIGMASLVLN